MKPIINKLVRCFNCGKIAHEISLETILDWGRRGVNKTALAEKLGCSRATLYRAIDRAKKAK